MSGSSGSRTRALIALSAAMTGMAASGLLFAQSGETGGPPAPAPEAAASAQAPDAAAVPLQPGQTVERIACGTDPSQTYALYLPTAYTTQKTWPVLIVMDPRGRAQVAMDLFRDPAEKLGWVVASSWDTMSDGDWEINEKALRAMLPDVQRRIALDPKRLYLAGFSGTARVAWSFGYRIRGVAGLIGIGGALPFPFAELKDGPFAFFGATGTTDFNYEEMRTLDRALDKTNIPHRTTWFEGGHQWCPPDVCAEAMSWLELMAMKRGLKIADPAWLDAEFNARIARAKEKETAGAAYEAWALYEGIRTDFEGTPATANVKQAGERAAALGGSEQVKDAVKKAEHYGRAQATYERTLGDFLAAYKKGAPPPLSRSMSQLQIRPLMKRAAGTDDPADALAAQRLLELVFSSTAFYEPRDYMTAGDPARALAMLQVADVIKPKSPQVCWGIAKAQTRLGRIDEALDALECVIDSGAADPARIESEESLAPLRANPRYKTLLDRLLNSASK